MLDVSESLHIHFVFFTASSINFISEMLFINAKLVSSTLNFDEICTFSIALGTEAMWGLRVPTPE